MEPLTGFVASATPTIVRLLGPAAGRCLEIGCGTGIHQSALADASWSVVGLDVSTDQLRLARERLPAAELVLGDAADLPFENSSFHAVAIAFLHTDVDDFAAVCREAFRVLRPQGRFVHVGTHPCFVGGFAQGAASGRAARAPCGLPGGGLAERRTRASDTKA